MTTLKSLSKKIDDVLDYFSSDPDYVLSRTVGVKLRKSMSRQKATALAEAIKLLKNMVPDLLSGEGRAPWKSYLLNMPLGLLRDNLHYLINQLRESDSTSRQVKLTSYEPLDVKFKLLDSDKIPIDTLVAVLYGPPGTGKSNYAHYLGKLVGWGVHRLNLYTNGRDEDRELREASEIVALIDDCGGVFLVDEIDLLIAEDKKIVRLLHEVLDDIKAKNVSCAIIMTTNNIEAIRHTPLCRPGRVDIIHEVGKLVEADLANICKVYDVTYEEMCARDGDKSTVASVVAICRDIIMERYGFLRGDRDAVGE